MRKLETSTVESTISELSPTRSKKFTTIPKHHVNLALTGYLRSMSLIEDDEEVTNFNKAPDSLDVKIEKVIP